ncbi:hypothetical protein [Saccharothrix syringae]|uniref:Secreted protein n=1 Tax=Saccharothrix syringae TaxID=103733 RepID=A0A5Q0HCR7_SACSY|nr:hypothetical protein [Saccharothrix syringae]QFZ23610.1 hypothetical protein EKG83_44745 [Saccharothrix syringae]
MRTLGRLVVAAGATAAVLLAAPMANAADAPTEISQKVDSPRTPDSKFLPGLSLVNQVLGALGTGVSGGGLGNLGGGGLGNVGG